METKNTNKIIKVLSNDNLLRLFLKTSASSHRILYYHLISERVPDYYYKNAAISPKILKEQLIWLINNGFKHIDLDTAFLQTSEGISLKKTFSITTDDGFRENFQYLMDILSSFQFSCTHFVNNSSINNKDLIWDNKIFYIANKVTHAVQEKIIEKVEKKYSIPCASRSLCKYAYEWPMSQKDEIANYCWSLADVGPLEEFLEKRQPYMTDLQISELLRAGHTLGSHSYTHPDFSELNISEMQKEYIDSKNDLEKRFKVKIKHFAYPYGKRPDLKIEESYRKASGYDLMLGIKNNLSNSFPRYYWERDKMEFDKLNKGKVFFVYVPVLRKYILNPLRILK